MSVTTETNRTSALTTDGVIEEFDFDMLVHSTSEVQVWYKPSGGSYTELTLNTDYGVTFTEDGGTVSTNGYTAPLAAGELLIIRHLELTEETNWLYNDNHTGQTHQDDFDRGCIRDIQQQEELDRCPKFLTHSSTTGIDFPEPVANELVGWNAGGTNLANLSISAIAVLVSAQIIAGTVPENLTDLTGVTITGPAAGQILYYDGSLWLNSNTPTLTSITIGANTLNTNEWANLDGLDQALKTTDSPGFASGVTIGTLTLADGSITDSGGTIDFGNENLTTSGNITGDLVEAVSYLTLNRNAGGYSLTIHGDTGAYSGDRALNIDVNNANRAFDLSGDLTIEATSIINSDLSTDANWETSGSITGGSLVTGGTITATSYIKTNSNIQLKDPLVAFYLKLATNAGSISADRNLNIDVGDATRTFTLAGDLDVEAASIINSDLSTDANWATSGSITGGSLLTGGNIGIAADIDLLQLAANALIINGTVGIGTSNPVSTLHVLNAEDNANVTIFNLEGKRGTPTNNDTMYIYYRMNNSAPASYEYARTTITAEDITDGEEEGSLLFEISRAGTLETALKMSANEIVLNEAGADRDLRIEGIGAPNALFIQGSDGNVGIGTASPTGKLSVGSAAGEDVYLFYDNADVGDAVDGQSLYIYRRAAEADDYIRLYIENSRRGRIDSPYRLALAVGGNIKVYWDADYVRYYTDILMVADGRKIRFGAGSDATIQYDGTNMIIDPKEVGSGYLSVLGDVNATGYKVGTVQVVGARVIDVRCDDALNSGDATTDGVIDSLRDAMIAHGLIAAA